MLRNVEVVGLVAIALEDALELPKQVIETGSTTAGMSLVEDVTTTGTMQGPEVAQACFAGAGGEVFDRSFIGLKVATGQQVPMDVLVEWLEPEGGEFSPVAEGVAADGDTVAAGEDLLQSSARNLTGSFRSVGIEIMSLEKAIKHGKEHRKSYRGSRLVDSSCRNHGGCLWCAEGRQYSSRRRKPAPDAESENP
jgi:hypothetical protein